ncbi:MAG: DUF3276 family protein [Treponema sp.]|jgi:hypothetical protein|nr:DUF3276 family protein [Treponema sp.]
MGIRGEIFSTKVILPNRSYFFNVKENRLGDLYLNIVESKNQETGGFERQSVILFAEDLQEFLQGFDESLKVLEKAVREKRRTRSAEAKPSGESPEGRGRPAGGGRSRLVVKRGRSPNAPGKGPSSRSPGRGPASGPPGKAIVRRPRRKD